MRGIMISLTVIFLSMAIGIVNVAEERHFTETGRPLFGFTTNASVNLNNLGLDDRGTQSRLNTDVKAGERKESSFVESLYDFGKYILNFLVFLREVIWNSTFGLSSFLQHFGRSDWNIIPDYIADMISLGVNLNHSWVLYQILTGKNMKDGI